MSLLIKGMDMPECCEVCPCYNWIEDICRITESPNDFSDARIEDCPLVEVSTPHGRLIDADRLEDRIKNMVGKYDTAIPLNVVYRLIADAHPIIEAEEEQ